MHTLYTSGKITPKMLFTGAFITIVAAVGFTASAQVMTSPSYQIQSDSVNFGGGLSSSTNYVMEDTYGEIATGESTSTTYALKAGYQQMQEVFLSMTAASNVNLTPDIPGLTGGSATGSTYVIVTTDSPSGYELSIKAENDPAMQSGGNSFADYVPAGALPDFAFSITAADSEFGYTPEGADIPQYFQDNVGVCNALGGDTPDACWEGLGTTDRAISRSTSANHPYGATTTIKFQAESGGSHFQDPGTYTATTTLTLLAL